MILINTVIKPQAFEIVRDRIGRILTEELDNQFQISYRPELKVSNWIERFIQFDKTELPAVNVTLGEGSYDGQTAIQSDGIYRYYIDCYVNAKSGTSNPGDSRAMRKLHTLVGVCRAIIMDPRYNTLAFAVRPGFIMNRHFETLQIENPRQKEHDADNTVMSRLVLSVKMPEITDTAQPRNLSDYFTQVKLADTQNGYQWLRSVDGIFDYSFDSTFQ